MTDIKIVGPIVSKYAGWCRSCGATIAVGEKVYWVSGVGAWHEDCDRPRSLAMYHREAGQKAAQHRPSFDP